ncbi:MAG: hypothetical protein UW76_C0002G0006 [Parcubacteria group bacterium GW2011_GWF2_44_8b]|nr:MAG: hypothetical protein UV94_C0004G0027 [Parcubacteria group bacterium GW2011_GWC1_43_30]KKT80909.1 MAG: hypothetical protein UW76_C0002G0006 [Parcubacteria group bacterium GW2011_GWF2_44_8b]
MDDDILKDEDELNEDIIDIEKKKIDPLVNPLDEAESVDDLVEEEEEEEEPFDDVNPI